MPIDLKRISSGKEERAPRVLVHGADGIGKTKFAAGAPDPFFIDVNKGSLKYDVKRMITNSWSEATELVQLIESGAIKCQTVVIDSLSDLEPMGNNEFFPGTTIDKWDGGYGRGETYALTRWREFLASLERVWAQGKTIIFVAHTQVKHFDDPTGPGYDRFVLSAREKIAGLIRQWSDYVLFCREEVSQQKVAGDVKAVTSGVRWAYTKRCPAFDAKSRGTTLFPERFLLSWDEFQKALSAEAERVDALRKEIDMMLKEIGDKNLNEMVKVYLKSYPDQIVEARNRVAARFEESKQPKEKSE